MQGSSPRHQTSAYSSPQRSYCTHKHGVSFSRAIVWHIGAEPPQALMTILSAAGSFAGAGTDVLAVTAQALSLARAMDNNNEDGSVAILVTDRSLESAGARLAEQLAKFTSRVAVKRVELNPGLSIRPITSHASTTKHIAIPGRTTQSTIEPKPIAGIHTQIRPDSQQSSLLDAVFEQTHTNRTRVMNRIV
ncbi:MAG: hypothetical protein H6815_01045 [Phycisphaeraceae bacterium]|nr:hypothetical protein [Phycisphaerales bacterium]MCB9859012.1 hypothetical protein [Phycisphaeraceae bacterium]